ncbi:MAG: radical SAM protein [Candidatus Bathyarchaeia archaeon]
MKLRHFNVVKAAYCTCLPKYNINPYLGRCAHRCIYCYAVKFPSFSGPTTPRLNLIKDIVTMVRNTKEKLPVMLSDCTDPYQPMEEEYKITRRCIEVLAGNGFPLLIVTKSDLVTRDIDVFKRTPTVVSITITTSRKDIARLIEPYAPLPDRRFSALERISNEGIPTVLRIDPMIPTLTSDKEDLEQMISKAREAGVTQVTASTLKPVRGFFQSLKKAHSGIFRTLSKAYADGEWVSGYKYLERTKRLKMLKEARSMTLKYGLEFATCREGFPELNTTICDGTAYCRGMLISNYLR